MLSTELHVHVHEAGDWLADLLCVERLSELWSRAKCAGRMCSRAEHETRQMHDCMSVFVVCYMYCI